MDRKHSLFLWFASITSTLIIKDNNYLEKLEVPSLQNQFVVFEDPKFISEIKTYRNSLFFQLNEHIMELDARTLQVKRKCFLGPAIHTFGLALWNDTILVTLETTLRLCKLKGNELELICSKEIAKRDFPRAALIDAEHILLVQDDEVVVCKKKDWEISWNLGWNLQHEELPVYFIDDISGSLWFADISDRQWSVAVAK